MIEIKIESFDKIKDCEHFLYKVRLLYPGFDDWCTKKIESKENAFCAYSGNDIVGFSYIKKEKPEDYGKINFLKESFDGFEVIKIGCFITNEDHTGVGAPLMDDIIKSVKKTKESYIYGTIFASQYKIIEFLKKKYDFDYVGQKMTNTGPELIYAKSMNKK